MFELIIMRHAKSDWARGELSDFDRPLNARGLRTAPAMGSFLTEQDVAPDHVLCSTANRARQTLDLVLPAMPNPPTVDYEDSLYLAAPMHLREQVSKVQASVRRLMIVGHNPGLSLFATYLSGEDFELPTAAVVRLYCDDSSSWSDASQQNAWRADAFWHPREVLTQSSELN